MRAYYNEHDPFAAAWLRNLIAAGHIAPGYTYRNRVDDPEWEIAKAAILSAVASPASREARRAPPEPV